MLDFLETVFDVFSWFVNAVVDLISSIINFSIQLSEGFRLALQIIMELPAQYVVPITGLIAYSVIVAVFHKGAD